MPVEIRELIIRAVAAEDRDPAAKLPTTQAAAGDKADIVEACVRQVLKILQKSKER